MQEKNGQNVNQSKKSEISPLVGLVGLLEQPQPCLIDCASLLAKKTKDEFLQRTSWNVAIIVETGATEDISTNHGVFGPKPELSPEDSTMTPKLASPTNLSLVPITFTQKNTKTVPVESITLPTARESVFLSMERTIKKIEFWENLSIKYKRSIT